MLSIVYCRAFFSQTDCLVYKIPKISPAFLGAQSHSCRNTCMKKREKEWSVSDSRRLNCILTALCEQMTSLSRSQIKSKFSAIKDWKLQFNVTSELHLVTEVKTYTVKEEKSKADSACNCVEWYYYIPGTHTHTYVHTHTPSLTLNKLLHFTLHANPLNSLFTQK